MSERLAHPNAKTNASTAGQFLGTENPRHLRAIAMLMHRPMPREALDQAAGASNSPELVAELRRRGLEVPCVRVAFVDRDGRPCRPGVYAFTAGDRRKVLTWQRRREKALQRARWAKHDELVRCVDLFLSEFDLPQEVAP